MPPAEEATTSRTSYSWLESPALENALEDLRQHRGTHRYRRLIRTELRLRACEKSERYNLRTACVTNPSQIAAYVPPIDRPGLSTIAAEPFKSNERRLLGQATGIDAETLRRWLRDLHRRTSCVFSIIHAAALSVLRGALFPKAITSLEFGTQSTSRPGLMDLATETREQIYGYILPVHVQGKFHAKDCDIYNPDVFTRQYETGIESLVYRDRGGEQSTAIMRVNKKIYEEAEAYLFRGSTILILVDETGYAMLEHEKGGFFLAERDGSKSIRPYSRQTSGQRLDYQPRDRFTDWHQSYISRFDITLPRRLIIKLEAPQHNDRGGLIQIAENMMSLCTLLRKHLSIRELIVEPQMLEYRHIRDGYMFLSDQNTAGSYFVWQCSNSMGIMRRLPCSMSSWRSRDEEERVPCQRTAIWRGTLRKGLLKKLPDLAFVLHPLSTLGNVREASIKHPSAPLEASACVDVPCAELRAAIKGQGPYTIKREMAQWRQIIRGARSNMQSDECRLNIKRARRFKARDTWYLWNSETPEEEFVACGEQGYDSDDELDWYKVFEPTNS